MKATRAAYETKKAGNISSSTIENRSDIKADLEVEFEDFEEEQTDTIIVSFESACKRPSRHLGDSDRTKRQNEAAQSSSAGKSSYWFKKARDILQGESHTASAYRH